MTITTNGTVIDSKTINGLLVIHASGVVVRNSKITGGISTNTDTPNAAWTYSITDSRVDPGEVSGPVNDGSTARAQLAALRRPERRT
jgi:hypothetical protein